MAASVWKGHVTFGLVSFPVRLFSAARSESISFNQLHKHDNSRIKQVLFCQAEDKPIPRTEIVKGFEYEKDRYVVIDDEDVRKVAPKTAKTMEILEFVKTDEIDPIHFESSYYLAPEDSGRKPYALLFEVLRQSGYCGVAQLAMHNREHIVILRPVKKGILLHTMYYVDEIRQVDEFSTDTSLLQEKELGLAKMLVESLAATFDASKYKDTYRENLRAMIDTKVRGQEVVEPAEPHVAPVIDIMEALKRSLELKKKPVQSAETPLEVAESPAKERRPRRAARA